MNVGSQMTLHDIGSLFYGFHRHFNEPNFNFAESGYKLGYSTPAIQRYIKINNFLLYPFGPLFIMFAIINQLKYRRKDKQIVEFNEEDLRWFVNTLKFNENDYMRDIDWLYENVTSAHEIYEAHIKKRVQWFTLFYILKYAGNFQQFIANDFAEENFKSITVKIKQKIQLENVTCM